MFGENILVLFCNLCAAKVLALRHPLGGSMLELRPFHSHVVANCSATSIAMLEAMCTYACAGGFASPSARATCRHVDSSYYVQAGLAALNPKASNPKPKQ